jgi:protein-L-isoaspartate(D-aspartate) O-methyltransferase
MEILPALHASATQKIDELRKRGVISCPGLVTIRGDGSRGHREAAPYDAILVTAAPRKVPVDLLNQLKPGGRLVIPVGDYYQELQVIRRNEDGSFAEEKTVASVRFVPLVEE